MVVVQFIDIDQGENIIMMIVIIKEEEAVLIPDHLDLDQEDIKKTIETIVDILLVQDQTVKIIDIKKDINKNIQEEIDMIVGMIVDKEKIIIIEIKVYIN